MIRDGAANFDMLLIGVGLHNLTMDGAANFDMLLIGVGLHNLT